MKKQAIFFDLDGTLLSTNNSMSTETINLVSTLKNDGHKIFLATGRQYYGSIPFHQQLGLDTPLITLNGGAIYQPDGTLLHSTPLDTIFVETILLDNQFKKLTQMSNFETPNLSVLTARNKDMDSFLHAQMPAGLLPNFGYTTHHASAYPILKNAINLYSFIDTPKEESFLEYLQTALPETIDYRLANNGGLFAEFFPAHINKATGIEWVLNHLALDNYSTMAFGDGINDIEMLTHVNHGVAMVNGENAVLQIANDVTARTNADSGIADYLAAYFSI